MARVGLRWSRERLAHEANLGVVTIQRFEAGMNVADQSVALLAAAMEAAGATFSIDGDPTAPVGFCVAIRTVPQARSEAGAMGRQEPRSHDAR